MRHGAFDVADSAGEHGKGPVAAGKFEIEDEFGRGLLVERVVTLKLGDQQIGVGLRQRENDGALGGVVGKTGRVDDVVIGIEQQHVDAVFGHARTNVAMDGCVIVGAEALGEGHGDVLGVGPQGRPAPKRRPG